MKKNRTDNQKFKKYAVFALMGIAFAGCIWLIFSPSGADRQKQARAAGYNDRIPDPTGDGIIDDKRGAYQQESIKQRQQGEMVSPEEFSSLLAGEIARGEDERTTAGRAALPERPAIGSSAEAYRDISSTLGNFYEKPPADDREQEILALEWRLQEMERKLEEKDGKQSAIDEQATLMEKSYELAAKYLPQSQTPASARHPDETGMAGSSGKVKVSPVRQVRDRTVSALEQEYSDDERLSLYDRPRNYGFNTPGDVPAEPERNTVKACVHGDQTVMNGQSVFIRLLEPVGVEDAVIPAYALLTAKAALQGERLALEISSIEYEGMIYPVKLSVYDTDGVKGVYVPSSMELDALKEVAANMGNAMGNSYSITQSMGAQLASDMTKGLTQGASQYFNKKIKMVKVNLKAGHRLLLYPEKQ